MLNFENRSKNTFQSKYHKIIRKIHEVKMNWFFKRRCSIVSKKVSSTHSYEFLFIQEFLKPVKNRAMLRKNPLLRGWTLTMDIKPNGTVPGWSNILHATVDNNRGKYGGRTPGIWFHSNSNKLHICSAVSGNRNYCYSGIIALW